MPPIKMEIKYASRFRRQYSAADSTIRHAFAQTLELFLEEPDHPALRNHALTEKFAGYRSIDVTWDYRAVFKETTRGRQTVIEFYLLGTHKELYG